MPVQHCTPTTGRDQHQTATFICAPNVASSCEVQAPAQLGLSSATPPHVFLLQAARLRDSCLTLARPTSASSDVSACLRSTTRGPDRPRASGRTPATDQRAQGRDAAAARRAHAGGSPRDAGPTARHRSRRRAVLDSGTQGISEPERCGCTIARDMSATDHCGRTGSSAWVGAGT